MTQELVKFVNDDLNASIRTMLDENGEPLFCLKDLCNALEIEQITRVKERLDNEVISTHPIPDALGRMQQTYFVNEDGMYDVMLDSRKPEAKRFRKWITSEVLPSIRKTGSYSLQVLKDEIVLPKTYLEALKELVVKEEQNQLLLQQNNEQASQIKEMQPKVDIYERFLECKNSIDFSEFSAILSSNKFDIGRNRILKHLKEDKIFQRNNTPYQQYRNLGLFEVIMVETDIGWKPKTLITSKGMKYVYDLLVKKFRRRKSLV